MILIRAGVRCNLRLAPSVSGDFHGQRRASPSRDARNEKERGETIKLSSTFELDKNLDDDGGVNKLKKNSLF